MYPSLSTCVSALVDSGSERRSREQLTGCVSTARQYPGILLSPLCEPSIPYVFIVPIRLTHSSHTATYLMYLVRCLISHPNYQCRYVLQAWVGLNFVLLWRCISFAVGVDRYYSLLVECFDPVCVHRPHTTDTFFPYTTL